MQNFIKIILRGVGQVMLQNNAFTGLLFLVGIFYNSWIFGFGAIFGNIISTLSAKFFNYPKEDIENGSYGFNGTLLGIAIFYFFGFNFITIFVIIVGAIFSTIIMRIINKKIPALTAPFVVSAWVIMLGIIFFNLTPFVTSPLLQDSSLNLFSAITMSFGQIMFQVNIITGILFLLGIFINSRTSAFYALYGSMFGILLAVFISLPINMINVGLFGYNAVLCSIALEDNKKYAFLLVALSIILSVLFNFSLGKIGIITLTAPFVLSTWIALLIRKYFTTKLV